MRRRFSFLFSLLFTTLSFGQDLEPNNSPYDAGSIGGVKLFRGTFDSARDFDYFVIGNALDRSLELKITARILSGSAAGTDSFEMRWMVDGRDGFLGAFGNSRSAEGNRRIIRQKVHRQIPTETSGRVFLALSSPYAGEYEIRIEVGTFDREGPNISFRPFVRAHLRHEIPANRKEIRFLVRDHELLETIRVTSPGNRPLVLRPYAEGKRQSYMIVRYPLRRLQSRETVTIRAGDVLGNRRIRTVTFSRY